jgi:hypothetical protein
VLVVRRAKLAEFRAFEHGAAQVMARHGGAIERALVLDAGDAETLRELHVVRFPDEAARTAYAADPALAALRPLRDASVVSTELWPATEGPTYG